MRTKRENLAKWIIYRFIMLFSLGDDRKTMSREDFCCGEQETR